MRYRLAAEPAFMMTHKQRGGVRRSPSGTTNRNQRNGASMAFDSRRNCLMTPSFLSTFLRPCPASRRPYSFPESV
jgi:hypothetical protein